MKNVMLLVVVADVHLGTQGDGAGVGRKHTIDDF